MKAVITTDIIQSSHLDVEGRIWLNEKIETLKKWLAEEELINEIDFETFRGDSFQCLLHKPGMGLKTALLVKTAVKSWTSAQAIKILDVRVSLGIGEVEMQTAKLGTSDGEAFQLSGRRLDLMKKGKRTFCISTNDTYKEELEVESFLLETIISGMTALQCEVIQYKIVGQTESWIAEKLNIKQSAVNQRATNGSWHAIEKMMERFNIIYNGR